MKKSQDMYQDKRGIRWLREKPPLKELKLFLNDHEVKMLLLWAVISASAALAYIVWKRYPRIRYLAIPLFVLGMIQFMLSWGSYADFVRRVVHFGFTPFG